MTKRAPPAGRKRTMLRTRNVWLIMPRDRRRAVWLAHNRKQRDALVSVFQYPHFRCYPAILSWTEPPKRRPR